MRTGWMSSLHWLFVGPLILGVADGVLTQPTLRRNASRRVGVRVLLARSLGFRSGREPNPVLLAIVRRLVVVKAPKEVEWDSVGERRAR